MVHTLIEGCCDRRFARVAHEFRENLTSRGDVGASFAASVDGEIAIDIWGGHADRRRQVPWRRDTLVNVYSVTKTASALAVLILADRGQLGLDHKVARYWPEYAQGGKGGTEVRHLVAHTAGVPCFDPELSTADLYDWDRCVTNLSAQTPLWPPGTRFAYHLVTYGYLLGELVRRVTGRTIGAFFRDEIGVPLQADFHIGLADTDLRRVAESIPVRSSPAGFLSSLEQGSLARRVWGSPRITADHVNSRRWRQAELPSVGGHGNARAIVRAMTPLANDGRAFGVDLLSSQGCTRIREQQAQGVDPVLRIPIRFGLGFAFNKRYLSLSPNGTAMYWAGDGGSVVVVDQDARVCLAYAMNRQLSRVIGDRRVTRLATALYESL